MTDMIIDQMVMDGYDMEDKKLIDDLTVTINMMCGAISRVSKIPHFTHEILDAMHNELQALIDEEDEFDDEFDDGYNDD